MQQNVILRRAVLGVHLSGQSQLADVVEPPDDDFVRVCDREGGVVSAGHVYDVRRLAAVSVSAAGDPDGDLGRNEQSLLHRALVQALSNPPQLALLAGAPGEHLPARSQSQNVVSACKAKKVHFAKIPRAIYLA